MFSLKRIISIIFALLFIASVFLNVYLGIQLARFVEDFKSVYEKSKILAFRDMFEKNVFLSDIEIDFDTRLAMESAVRSLDNREILAQWQKFTKVTTQED